MTDHAQQSKGRRGCGPILVFLIAIVFLTMGTLMGSGGLYLYLSGADERVERLGLAPQIEAPETPEETPDPYALAYPLLDGLSVPDSLDRSAIRDHIQQERALLQECYIEELQRSPETRGEVDLQFSISGSSGEVTAAVTRANHTGSEALSDCLLSNIRQQWSFDPPDTGGVATVRFQALFLPLQG